MSKMPLSKRQDCNDNTRFVYTSLELTTLAFILSLAVVFRLLLLLLILLLLLLLLL